MQPRRWLVLTIKAPSAESAPLLAEGLFAVGASAVEERGTYLITYLPEVDEPADELAARLSAALELERGDVAWVRGQGRDWPEGWKRGLAPRRVGERMIVTPTWKIGRASCRERVERTEGGG